jgi:hypothetical protein
MQLDGVDAFEPDTGTADLERIAVGDPRDAGQGTGGSAIQCL